jgi:selenocysteine lyase/cysteine desulfurase
VTWRAATRPAHGATTRLSTYVYNDRSDIDIAIEGIVAAQKFFGV